MAYTDYVDVSQCTFCIYYVHKSMLNALHIVLSIYTYINNPLSDT